MFFPPPEIIDLAILLSELCSCGCDVECQNSNGTPEPYSQVHPGAGDRQCRPYLLIVNSLPNVEMLTAPNVLDGLVLMLDRLFVVGLVFIAGII